MSSFYKDTYGLNTSRRERAVLDVLATTPTELHTLTLALETEPRTVRSLVSKLRRKLDGTGWTISSNAGGASSSTAVYEVVRT